MRVVPEELLVLIALLQLDHEHVVSARCPALVEFIEGLRINVRPDHILPHALVLRLVKPEAYQIVYVLAYRAGRPAEDLGREED